jgi:hypothetical protein
VPLTQIAWKTKPSFGIIATEDKSIRPEIQEKMYSRSNTKISKIKGGHGVSQPGAAAKIIKEAAENASKSLYIKSADSNNQRAAQHCSSIFCRDFNQSAR